MKKAKEMCTTSGLHSSTIINAIELYTIDENSISVLVNYLNSTKISNVEILYNRLFNDIVRNSESYFVLEEKASRVISLKFVEILIGFLNKKEIVDGIETKNLSEKEVAGLHYLGGYVLHKIYRN